MSRKNGRVESWKEMIGEPVRVAWIDIVQETDWITEEKLEKLQDEYEEGFLFTYGILHAITDDTIVVKTTDSVHVDMLRKKDATVATGVFRFPLGAVTDIVRMEMAPKRRGRKK